MHTCLASTPIPMHLQLWEYSPLGDTLGHIKSASDGSDPPKVGEHSKDGEHSKTGEAGGESTSKATVITIGAGLPPVPQKLVSRIQAGEYVDMAELLPDQSMPAHR